jgi:hypothetical protein
LRRLALEAGRSLKDEQLRVSHIRELPSLYV